jgi:lysophospholipase L1-like esterase
LPAHRTSRSKRERLAELALLAGSTTLALGAFAAFDFVYSKQQQRDPFALSAPRNNGRSLYVHKPNGWYELNRNYRGEDRYGRHLFAVATDQHGLRIPSPAAAAPAKASSQHPALVFLGDSFTYGVGANWNDTYVGQVAKRYPGAVINAGVNSHSPTPHLYRLQRLLQEGAIPTGAIVVLAVDISDVQDEASRWQSTDAEPQERSAAAAAQVIERRGRTQPPPEAQTPLFSPRNFQLTHQIYYGLEALYKRFFDHWQIRNQARSAFTHRPWADLAQHYAPLGVEAALNQTRRRIEQIAQLSQRNGHPFWLLIYPWPAQLAYRDQFSWEQFIASSCQPATCSGVINTFPAFRQQVGADPHAAAWQERLYLKGDMHFSRSGNGVVAEAVLKALSSPSQGGP